jgi:hypothetical protein
LAPAIAGLFAGVFSLVALLIGKEQKVSEFRQAWIDGLRADVARFISHSHAVKGAADTRQANTTEAENWNRMRDDMVGINEAEALIKLRLNPNKQHYLEILNLLREESELFRLNNNSPSREALDQVEDRVISATQEVLSREWIRVKEGEPWYRRGKLIATILTVLCLILIPLFWAVISFASTIVGAR